MRKLSYLLLLVNFYSAQLSQASKDIFQVKLGDLETFIKTGQLETLSKVLANDGALVSDIFLGRGGAGQGGRGDQSNCLIFRR